MRLLELCEPLLLYVCRLNRSARKGGSHELNRVRGEILAIFDEIKSRAFADPAIGEQYRQIELALIFFVDFMIKESDLSFAGRWEELAYEREELAGDEKFFDLLDEALASGGEAATERLAVYYACIGLGFTGIYTGQPEYLRQKMMQCWTRLRDRTSSGELTRICPEAYENVNTTDLVEPPGRKLLGIAIMLVGMVIVLSVANFFLFKRTSQDLRDALNRINTNVAAKAAGPAGGGAAGREQDR